MGDLIIWGLITFIFYCFDCYVVKRNMRPGTTQKGIDYSFCRHIGRRHTNYSNDVLCIHKFEFFFMVYLTCCSNPTFFCPIMAVSRIKTRGRSQNTMFILTNHNICVISDSRNNSRSDNIRNLLISWMIIQAMERSTINDLEIRICSAKT